MVKLFGDAEKLKEPWWGEVLLAAWALADPAARDEAINLLDRSARGLKDAMVEVANDKGAFLESDSMKRVDQDDGNTVVVGGEELPRWRVRRDPGGAAALARRAAAVGEISLLKALEPVVDLVTAVDPITKDSALHEAAKRGRAGGWKFLVGLPGASDKAWNQLGQPPFVLAAASTTSPAGRASIDRLRKPPDCDAELECAEKTADCDAGAGPIVALARAASDGALDRAEKQLDAGADANAVLPGGKCVALHFAAVEGHAPMVGLLLERGADADGCSTEGRETPLYLAAKLGHTEAALRLLEGGANPSPLCAPVRQRGAKKTSPLGAACYNGHLDTASVLLDHNADVKQADEIGCAPLWKACMNGHFDVARLLLKRGADVNQANDNGASPLYVAAQNGHVDLVHFLFDREADLHQTYKDGASPLFFVCVLGHIDVVRLLLFLGADANMADGKGETPLMAAEKRGHEEIARMLRDSGAK